MAIRRNSALAALAVAGLALAACQDNSAIPKDVRPVSQALVSRMDQLQMRETSPVLVRIFKEESELEVWKQDTTGRFELLKVYPICRWSGELGPKVREGDRQAPEGFYTITPALMNPNSSYYLAINTGFPNTYDKANGHSGAFLMIHGDCSSRGCYAMTDEQIGEIYSLARESFLGGQQSFQIQAYPFRMTAANLARHRTNPLPEGAPRRVTFVKEEAAILNPNIAGWVPMSEPIPRREEAVLPPKRVYPLPPELLKKERAASAGQASP